MDITEFSTELFSLGGRNAIVTGGNTGLGKAFTLALAKAGADVFVPSALDEQHELRTLIEATGQRLEFVHADLTEPGAPQRIVESCVHTLGSVDILVNCAGIVSIADAPEFDRAQWDPMVAVNLTAAFELSRHAARHMIDRGSGKIINVASLFSFLGGRRSPAYAATKHGIVGLTKAYCDELAAHNIQVNAIAPGYFATAITEATRADEQASRQVLEHIPAGRWGAAADLMGAVVFLASPASNYVNGHVLTVDGGYLVR